MVSNAQGRLDILKPYLREKTCELVDENVLNFIGLLDSDREADRVDT
jgi:hypothetical protein